MTEIASFKQGIVNAMLICASRHSKHQLIDRLIAGAAGVAAQINVADDFGRTPLYWAVQVRDFQ
jgi:hypothetical protein